MCAKLPHAPNHLCMVVIMQNSTQEIADLQKTKVNAVAICPVTGHNLYSYRSGSLT